MLKKSSLVLWGAALFIAWNGLLLLFLWSRPASPGEGDRLTAEVIRLAQDAETELERQKELLRQIHRYSGLWGGAATRGSNHPQTSPTATLPSAAATHRSRQHGVTGVGDGLRPQHRPSVFG